MARTTVAYWQHVGTGEVFAVWVDAADIGAALFGDPARGAALYDLPTPADAETDDASGPCAWCHPRPRGGLHHPPALALRPPGHRTPRR